VSYAVPLLKPVVAVDGGGARVQGDLRAPLRAAAQAVALAEDAWRWTDLDQQDAAWAWLQACRNGRDTVLRLARSGQRMTGASVKPTRREVWWMVMVHEAAAGRPAGRTETDRLAGLEPHLVSLTDLLMEFGHQMIRLRAEAGAAGAPGYGVIAIRAMIRLGLVGPMSMGDLATALSVSPARATQIVDALERAGHIERHRSASDRRVWQIQLKPGPAAQVLEAEFSHPMAALRCAWADVPLGCRDAVLDFVAALVTGMRTSEDEYPSGSE
jgi:DNA-binding MarR family transcriptional regulator